MTEKTRWEVDLVDGVSGSARRQETALERLQRRFQRLSASSNAALASTAARFETFGAKMRRNWQILTRQYQGPLRTGFEENLRHPVQAAARTAGRAWSAAGQQAKRGWGAFAEWLPGKLKDATKLSGLLVAGSVLGVTAIAAKYADLGQKSRAAFSLMLGSQAAGESAWMESRKLAVDMGMKIDEVAGSYQRFISMGFKRGEAVELVKMGADMTALGASAEKVSSVLDAMGKIKATGTLQGDELMMLAEAGINIGSIYDRLGEQFGKTRAQIVKMKEAGKISSEDAISAIKATVLATTGQTEFGAARTKVMESTLSGAFQRMRSRMVDSLIGVGEEAAPRLTAMMSKVGDMVTKFLDSKSGKDFMGDAADLVSQVADTISASLPYVRQFIGAFSEGFGNTMSVIVDLMSDLFSQNGSSLLETMKSMGTAAGRLVALLAGAAGALSGLVFTIVRVGAAISNYVVSALDWVASKIFAISNAIENMASTTRSFLGMDIGEFAAKVAPPTAGAAAVPGVPAALNAQGKPSIANTTTNTVTVPVTVQAPAGGSEADGRTWGAGASKSIERGLLGALGGANAAAGT
jgi:tape measure domain-containing protein